MIDERQKPTTQAYLDNYDRIFRACPQCSVVGGKHKMDCTQAYADKQESKRAVRIGHSPHVDGRAGHLEIEK